MTSCILFYEPGHFCTISVFADWRYLPPRPLASLSLDSRFHSRLYDDLLHELAVVMVRLSCLLISARCLTSHCRTRHNAPHTRSMSITIPTPVSPPRSITSGTTDACLLSFVSKLVIILSWLFQSVGCGGYGCFPWPW